MLARCRSAMFRSSTRDPSQTAVNRVDPLVAVQFQRGHAAWHGSRHTPLVPAAGRIADNVPHGHPDTGVGQQMLGLVVDSR